MRPITRVLCVGLLAVCLPSVPAAAKQDLFTRAMRAHFRAAEICWKQDRVPSRMVVEAEIKAIKEAAHRFWPGQEEKANGV